MEKPYISFIVTARNDDYGGNWQNRINAFMKILAYQAKRTKLQCELVFVEYNPVENKKMLWEELNAPKNNFFETKFIIVPKEFHESLPDHQKVPICEFIGKNIGIRRASGEFICGTNPDILYSDELFDFFAKKELRKNFYYRINRRDTSINKFDKNMPPEKILLTAKRKIIKIMYANRTTYVSYKNWFDDLIHGRTWGIFIRCPLFNFLKTIDNSKIHENAAGDFLLMHKNSWSMVGGYDERTVGSGVLDGYIMYLLYCFDIKQKILGYPAYHMYHHHKGVVYLASHKELSADAKKMLENKIPYKKTNSNWGFSQQNFIEQKI